MSHADDVFIRNFLAVLGALVLFAIFAFFLARSIGAASTAKIQAAPKAVQERIKPVGQVTVGAAGTQAAVIAAATTAPAAAAAPSSAPEAMQTAAAAPAAASTAAKSGEQVYKAACIACHAAGVAGAPKLGDRAAWDPRLGQGLNGLVTSVIKGKNAMPAKGGNPALSDDEIKKAVEYMLAETGISPG